MNFLFDQYECAYFAHRFPTVTKEQLLESTIKSKDFAAKGNYEEYQRRNPGVSRNKFFDDTFIGKQGEFASAYFVDKYSEYGFVPPDCKQYPIHLKNYDPDHKYLEFNVHVKSRRNNNGFPPSWLFQRSNPSGGGGNDSLYSRPNRVRDIIFLMEIAENDTPYLVGWCTWRYAHSKLKNPIKKSLIGIKDALYEEDLDTTLSIDKTL